jgi:hypothetical protein
MSKDALPAVTSAVPPDLRLFLDRVREQLSGSGTNPIIRRSELTSTVDTAIDNLPDDGLIPVFTPEVPANLTAVAGFDFITLIWDRPTYYGHDASEVWRSPDNNFANAVLIATLDGRVSVFSDYVGTNTTYYYWVRFRNIDQVYGPYAGPVSAQTAYDVDELLEELTDQISESQLAEDLYNLTENLKDQYVVKVSADGVTMAGFGLVSTQTPDGAVTSEFGILADKFYLLPPVSYNQATQPTSASNGQLWRDGNGDYFIYDAGEWVAFDGIPFIVQTTPTTIGDLEVPAGVYIKDAFIRNASIVNSKMAEASIDTANIVNAAITSAKVSNLDAAKIQTGSIQSYGFNNSSNPGFLLSLGRTEVINQSTGEVFFSGLEDPQLIIRSANSSTPALQLLNGVVSINALNIVNTLQSQGFGGATAGFQFDINNGTFQITDQNGATILGVGGYNGDLVENSISQRLNELQGAAETADEKAGDADIKAGDALEAAGLADEKAGGAQLAAQDAQEELDDIFVFDETLNGGVGAYKFTAGSYDTFFSEQNQLKAYAFLEKITKDNFETYIESAAIGRAAIGLAAIDTAQINDLAVANAKLGLLAVKEANIDSLAVSTLKIAGNAVTVPLGNSEYFSTNVYADSNQQQIGNTVTLGAWDYAGGVNNPRFGPEAVTVIARVDFQGSGSTPGGSAAATATVRVVVEVLSVANNWIELGAADALSYAANSLARDFGGQVVSSFSIDLPWWSVNVRFKVKVQNVPAGGDGAATRRVSNYSIAVLASKR